jgi:hypothetical protein
MITDTQDPQWFPYIRERVGDKQGLERWSVGQANENGAHATICDVRDWPNSQARGIAYLLAAAPQMVKAIHAAFNLLDNRFEGDPSEAVVLDQLTRALDKASLISYTDYHF